MKISVFFKCLWLRASLIYINNYPTICNTKLSIYNSVSSLYMFRMPTTPIITQASTTTLEGGSCTKNMTSTGGGSYSFVYS